MTEQPTYDNNGTTPYQESHTPSTVTPAAPPTETEEIQVNGINESAQESKPRSASRHKMTASLQMVHGHAVEDASLRELCFAKFIVKFPFYLCLIVLAILTLITYIDYTLFELSDNSNRTFLVEDNPYVEAYDAYTLSGQFIADNTVSNDTVLPQTQKDDYWMYQIMFTLKDYKDDFDANNAEKTDYWILTPENIEIIIKYEDMIIYDNEWKNRFCYVGDDPLSTNYSCSPAIQSAARWIYDLPGFDNMTTDDIKEWMDPRMSAMSFFFNPGADETGQTFIYRSFLAAALPIATDKETINGSTIHETIYANPLDEAIEQELAYVEWASDLFKEITVKHNGDLMDGDLKVLAVSWIVYSDYFNVLLNESMLYLIFSVLIVLFYMSFHLSSPFLAFASLIQILMSFPLAYFFYRVVLQIPHYDTLSSLIIFVLLGVGADDVFVFTDAWLQSTHFIKGGLTTIHEPDCRDKYCCACCIDSNEGELILRMSFAYRRAAKAMLVTQMTTFFAFLATATSAIMPISGFGIWAASVVAMNYFLVITLYPAILIIHYRYIKPYELRYLCCLCNALSCLCKKPADATASASASAIDNDINTGGLDMMPEISRQFSTDVEPDEYRCFEMFLGRKWSKWIIKLKIPILIFFAIVFIGAAIIGSQIEAESKDPPWFDDEHFMQKAVDEAGLFSASETDNLVQMHLTFGIKGVDRDGYSRWNPNEYGEVVWDSTFSISDTQAQSYLLYICDIVRNTSLVYAPRLVTCPIEDFKKYLLSIDDSFPYDETQHSTSFGSVYNAFLNSAFGTDAKAGALTFLDEEDDGEYVVRFYAMYIYTDVTWNDGAIESRAHRGEWDTLIDEFSKECPDGVCNSVNNVSLRWCWLETQQEFVRSAVQGILIAMPLAFIVLLLSTQNWIISVFAVIDIIGIMLCELSIMYFMGWKFGVSESVAIVIIIGFSVDYVVHLANAYLESASETREQRLSFALLTMGISVVSGAVTTFGAGFFLIFPAISFFFKMGILMISTVAIAILWAMAFFTSMCALCGPEGDSGNLKKLFRCRTKDKNRETKIETRKETYQDYKIEDGEMKPYELEMGIHTQTK